MRLKVDKPNKALLENIVKIAKQKRYTLKEIADAAGITYRTLRNYLDGDRDMTVATAEKIATFLGYTLTGLIQWKQK